MRFDRSLTRWAVPVGAAAVVGAVAAAPSATAASAHPRLPARSATQLVAAVEQCHVQALFGTVSTTANLGLPQLPDRLAGGATGLQALLTGTHQLRVWIAGPERQRLALLGELAESDVVHNGRDLWTYVSTTNTVTHRTLPSTAGPGKEAADHVNAEPLPTPEAAAAKLLHAVDPSTVVTVDRTVRVAGRPAYQIVLTPRTHATLIRSVRIAIDATTSLPLRVQLYAVGSSSPAWQTGFTKISYATPSARVFRFSPPRGAAISNANVGAPGLRHPDTTRRRSPDRAAHPTTIGSGWISVMELPAGTVDLTGPSTGGGETGGHSFASLLDRVTRPVPAGRLLTTRLLSVLFTNDGRVFLGAVPARTVEQAAADAGG